MTMPSPRNVVSDERTEGGSVLTSRLIAPSNASMCLLEPVTARLFTLKPKSVVSGVELTNVSVRPVHATEAMLTPVGETSLAVN